jgi:hypothetical protein
MTGWGWFWMTFGAIFWILLIAGVIYVAVQLAQQHARRS